MSDRPVTSGSGENPTARPAIDRMVGHLTTHGMPVKEAERIARNEARKADDGRGAKRR